MRSLFCRFATPYTPNALFLRFHIVLFVTWNSLKHNEVCIVSCVWQVPVNICKKLKHFLIGLPLKCYERLPASLQILIYYFFFYVLPMWACLTIGVMFTWQTRRFHTVPEYVCLLFTLLDSITPASPGRALRTFLVMQIPSMFIGACVCNSVKYY